MRITHSQHVSPDIQPAPHISWDCVPLLKLQSLFNKVLQDVFPENDGIVPLEKGKKRVGSPLHMQMAKRRKSVPHGEGFAHGHTQRVNSFSLDLETLPRYRDLQTKLPVWRHTFALRYTRSPDQSPLAEFLRVLNILCENFDQRTTVDVGQCRILALDVDKKMVAVWGREQPDLHHDWLLLPPSTYEEDYIGVLQSCYELQHIQINKVDIQAQMKINIFPDASQDLNEPELPFELQLEVMVSMEHPSYFNFLDRRLPRHRTNFIRQHQRNLCHFLYGRSDENSWAHVIDIPFFYSALTSAPHAPSPLADAAMQPDTLLPTLLPFQRRSVAWLLAREGKEVNFKGEIISKTNGDDYSFVETVQEENKTFTYNRLARTLSTEKHDVERILGGILAEEPGLGKTLEIIALILLNPAPEDRTPAMIRWDPETNLNVKAVKTTLIVTPTALVGQWVDEIAVHAPSLKVFVYEGWSKVKVPILNTSEEKKRVRRLLKGKAQAKFVSNTLKHSKESSSRNARVNTQEKKYVFANDDFTEDTVPTDVVVEEEEEFPEWCDFVQGFDIVITNYSVLRSDFNVARGAIKRSRRQDVVYANIERPRSPLVMVEWVRVVMDEVQMVGGGKTEDMVSLIPRLASFAVSGTPSRSHVSDLSHVLKFLRADAIVGGPNLWNALLQPHNAGEFAAFFQNYAIRTVKADVKDELTIPQQTRYVVGIELGPVEREVYDQMLRAMLNDLCLDSHGVCTSPGGQVDTASLRSSLRKLRAICTHPQVGQLQRQGDKITSKPGALKSMEDVLEDLKDKNWRLTMDDVKAKIQGLCVLAQYQQHTQDPNRYRQALETLKTAENGINHLIDELQTTIRQHQERSKALHILVDEGNADQQLTEGHSVEGSGANNKGKERETSFSDENIPKTAAGEEYAIKRRAFLQRMREFRLVLHRIKFLQGDVYNVLGDQYSLSETEAYGVAEEIRRDLLKGAEEEANGLMAALSDSKTQVGRDSVAAADLLIGVPYLSDGYREQNLLDLRAEADRVIGTVLNEQSVLLWEWRTCIVQLLSQKLNPGEGEADGQEYQRTLDNQGEAEVYLQLYATLLADRREALLHERTLLAMHDVREKKLRKTAAALRAAAALEQLSSSKDHRLEIPNEVVLQPEHEATYAELTFKRKVILEKLGNKALRTIASDLHAVAASFRNDDDPRKLWAKNGSNQIKRLITEQEMLHDKLDADLTYLRKVFNHRIIYFRQLQEISDSVVQVEWDGSVETAIQEEIAENEALEIKIKAGRAKQRYLSNLVQSKGRLDTDEDGDVCVLCKCEFVRGYITPCAHIFCEGCMKAWMARKGGGICPMCRVYIDPNSLQRFSVRSNPQPEPKSRQHTESNGNKTIPKSRRTITYNTIHPEIFEAIQQVEVLGDFGSKIQTLVKHLLYLQLNDSGSKSIVFSAWADSLHIVQIALSHNGIRSLRIDQNSKGDSAAKMFRKDPDIPVLLLHGERENAGLNLTCASRVFLLESVVHHGFELQAIARIDRLGQTRPTEVYCYYAENTVERNILDLAARQGVSLYTKENAAGTLNVSSFELDDSKKVIDSPARKKIQKGDFIFRVDDMLAILFPHMSEDVEYLVPDEVGTGGGARIPAASYTECQSGGQHSGQRHRQENAVAGPSQMRL